MVSGVTRAWLRLRMMKDTPAFLCSLACAGPRAVLPTIWYDGHS
jgi:hypothetical protein